MFKSVPVEIRNHYDFDVENRPFTIGIPCAEAAIFPQQNLRLDCGGQALPFHVTMLASWPDGSLKWLLLDFQASIKAGQQLQLQLQLANAGAQPVAPAKLQFHEDEEHCLIDAGVAQFRISKQQAGLFEQVSFAGAPLLAAASSVLLLDEQGEAAKAVVAAVQCVDPENTLRKKLSMDGSLQNKAGDRLADFNLKLTFFAGLATVKAEFTLANPRAAEHPGGVWDLGDKGSLFFQALSLQLTLAEHGDAFLRLSPEADWQPVSFSSLNLTQYSSGGDNWQSNNHVNFKGEMPLKIKGYRYSEQGIEQAAGERATPSLHLASARGGVTVHVVDFWQNFPKALQLEKGSLSLALFPRDESECYELQGGERKRHDFYLDFSNNRASLDSFVQDMPVQIPLAHYAATKVIPWLPGHHQDSEIQKLIDRGIEGEKNFFEKREIIDEFGWRNFGEVYADHEGLEYKGDDELISHYNNQYDPVYGFIKQYLISGDRRWHALLSTLAQHVADIDIYHTVEDRDEYNGGLFWHTHHYLNAFTCTHRTFSSQHADDFIYGEIGGGPGDEHCYTTGLACYYFLTGDETYKEASLQLTHWLTRLLEGSGTLIERVFQFKSKELPIVRRLLAGETVQRYRYPFTRGTGNYITALLDAYNLTGQRQYLLSVERVIRQSIHPHDDIALRNLHDTESTWSYLIYLQAVCKYLDLKTRLHEIDEPCLYARDSLLHYVDWMLENEAPFLESPEKLEYPNHTWTAQDLRKAGLFRVASQYSESKKADYLKAAEYYVQFVVNTLRHEETRHYARILILLMQNDLHSEALDYEAARPLREATGVVSYSAPPLYSLPGIMLGFARDMSVRLFRLSLRKEKRWLSFRMK